MELNMELTDKTPIVFYNIQYKELDFDTPNTLELTLGDIVTDGTSLLNVIRTAQNSYDKLSSITGRTVTAYEWDIDLFDK